MQRPTPPRDVLEERIAICVEAGVREERARAIAECEARGGRCTCGAGHVRGAR